MYRKSLQELAREAHENSCAKGFWGEKHPHEPHTFESIGGAVVLAQKLMLIVSEASEALEDARDGSMVTRFKSKAGEFYEQQISANRLKPVGFGSELADIVIRTIELAEALGYDIQEEVELKMAHNATRPAMHGRNS